MKTLSETEVLQRADALSKRHRSDWCLLVRDAVVGRTAKQLAKLLGRSTTWVTDHLKGAAVLGVIDGSSTRTPAPLTLENVREVMNFPPEHPDPADVSSRELDGFTPEVARIMARAHAAAEVTVDKREIFLSQSEDEKRFLQAIVPARIGWNLKLGRALAKVSQAINFLEDGVVQFLRESETQERIAEIDNRWRQQMEFVKNLAAEGDDFGDGGT